MKQIQKLLAASHETGSKNQLTLDNVKVSIAEYLEMQAEEIERFPELKSASHWDLIAADYDSTKEA